MRWRPGDGSRPVQALGYLRKAVDAYRRGFVSDIRDFYPGINLLTLLDVIGDEKSDAEKRALIPVVRVAAELRMGCTPDYWDHATLLELAILEDNRERALVHLADAVAEIREPFQPATTCRNLTVIKNARAARGAVPSWYEDVIGELARRHL